MPMYQCHVSNKILISCPVWSLMDITLYVRAHCSWVGQLSLSVAKNKMGKGKRSYNRWMCKQDNSESILSSLLEFQVIPPPVLETTAAMAQGHWNPRRHPMLTLTSPSLMNRGVGKGKSLSLEGPEVCVITRRFFFSSTAAESSWNSPAHTLPRDPLQRDLCPRYCGYL